MLLYAKVAQPKAPKKRSRAGCTHCKEKKKKCDEVRPQCQRCAEKRLDCVYESVKPRQRRRQTSKEPLSPLSPLHPPSLDLSFQPYDDPLGAWDDETRANTAANAGAVVPRKPAHTAPLLTDLLSPSLTAGLPPLDPQEQTYDAPAPKDDEETTTDTATDAMSLTKATRAKDISLSIPSPSLPGVFSQPPPHLKFLTPLYAEFADLHRRRTLVDHFYNVLSRLIVLNEDSGNPFQRLILPMCQRSEAVRNAVYALASAHREYRGLVTDGGGENSAFFYNQAIQGITMLIEKGAKSCRNELLAAIMLLVYYEVLVKDGDGSTNIVDGHLKGAMSVISATSEGLDDTGVFLERAFRFYEVISALSFGTAPLTSPPATERAAAPPKPSPSQVGDVDTLLGMASTLWPILHKLSTLLALKREIESASSSADPASTAALQSEFETSAYGVDVALKKWKPNLPPQLYVVSNDETSSSYGDDIYDAEGHATAASHRAHLQSVLNNALAYQHSAIVYLHRTIYGHSRRHALVQRHAHVALTHCVATVRNGGPMGALLWPLFVAACEAVTLGDRDLARQTFVVLGQRQGMLNIERAWFIIEEVWRRTDTAEEFAKASQGGSGTLPIFKGRDLWRRVSEEMGVTIVFG